MFLIIISGLAGIIGTGLGGVIGLFFGKKEVGTVSLVLSFASGVMISIAMLDLIPEANSLTDAFTTSYGVLFGVGIVGLLNYVIDNKTKTSALRVQTHSTLEELHHQDKYIKYQKQADQFLRAGIIMLLAITLHNFPEGMAISASGLIDVKLGVTMAVLLALHNIPEGMAITVPLIAGGVNRSKAFILIILAGATTILGGVFGYIIGNISDIFLAFSIAFAAGAMLYVTLCEILPQAILMENNRKPALFSIFGIVTGFLITTIL